MFYTGPVAGWFGLETLDEVAPMLRLVLPQAKRDRLARRMGAVAPRRRCAVWGCSSQALTAVLLESEVEAVLCPRHGLVYLDGQPVEGQPVFATAAW
jgi:hypothetical protein